MTPCKNCGKPVLEVLGDQTHNSAICITNLRESVASLTSSLQLATERMGAAEKELSDIKSVNPYPYGRTEDALECSQCTWKGYEVDAIEREDEDEGGQFFCPKCDEICAHLPINELDSSVKEKAETNQRRLNEAYARLSQLEAENLALFAAATGEGLKVWHSEEDGGFLAIREDLPSISGFGPTPAQALMHLAAAATLAFQSLQDSSQTRAEMQAQEVERLEGVVSKLYCSSCHNTGWIDSDGNCGNCELGRVKGERERLKEPLKWAVEFIRCNFPNAAEQYLDFQYADNLSKSFSIEGVFTEIRHRNELLTEQVASLTASLAAATETKEAAIEFATKLINKAALHFPEDGEWFIVDGIAKKEAEFLLGQNILKRNDEGLFRWQSSAREDTCEK